MRETVVEVAEPPFRWIDVVAPEPEELEQIAREFGFHAMSVEDCLDPWHLPKYERFGETTFVILRVYDDRSPEKWSSVQEMTRKIAIFFRPELVVTIHRADLRMVATVRAQFQDGNRRREVEGSAGSRGAGGGGGGGGGGKAEQVAAVPLVGALFNGALDSFADPLERAEEQVGNLEEALLSVHRRSPDLEAIHHLKQRVNLIKRLFWQTNMALQKLVAPGGVETHNVIFHDVKENAESYFFYADELMEEVSNLLGIHVALSSQRTNEVMRVLTVFSAFFLPLTFVVGVYGMNFDWMPELRVRWGYPAVLLGMAVVCLIIGLWFRRRGWWGGAEH
jgi:magnesium transporter